MRPKPAPITPNALHLRQALDQSAPLARLQERLRESGERFEAIRSCMPAALCLHVRPGPIDENGWCLLCDNAAVGAKLRQVLPRIESALRAGGWQVSAIRIKVQSR